MHFSYFSPDSWLDNQSNYKYVKDLHTLLGRNDIHVFIFLGAGLSFGVGRVRKETDKDEIEFEFSEKDNGDRFPSWLQLVDRMKKQLYLHPLLKGKKRLIDSFFREA